MKNRYLSLDILRGITIFGMVFCATIPYGVLPAWMYHIQTPPPHHHVDLTLTGLSWVDLVFPIFIFCMGVAIPLSGRRSVAVAQGGSSSFVKKSVGRFFMLWLFSYLYVILNFGDVDSFWAQLLTLAGFVALFPLYMVVKDPKRRRFASIAGAVAVAGIALAGHLFFGEVISLGRRGIIIFLLAFLYLFASLIWYYTRDKIRMRGLIFLIVLIFTAITKYFDLDQKVYAIENLRWILNLEYFYFLLILIPATFVGDFIYKQFEESKGNYGNIGAEPPVRHLFYLFMPLMVAWLCYAFYMHFFISNLIVSISFITMGMVYIRRYAPHYSDIFILASVALIAGILIEIPEGGIQKSPCTISYCFVSFSISLYLLIFTDYISHYLSRTVVARVLSGAGSNPLMSYIAFNSMLLPIFKMTGVIFLYRLSFPAGYPWIGVVSAAVFVFFMMSLVAKLSEKRIFWKA